MFHRTVPSKRTANPSRVVLLQRTLIAVVQGGSDRSCAKRSVAPPGDVKVTGRFKRADGSAGRSLGEDHRSVSIDQGLEVVPGMGLDVRCLGRRCTSSQVARTAGEPCVGHPAIRGDQTHRESISLAVAKWREEEVGRSAIGTGLHVQRAVEWVERDRDPLDGTIGPDPANRITQHDGGQPGRSG